MHDYLIERTKIEHALKEWCPNGRKATQITFSEDTARLRFDTWLLPLSFTLNVCHFDSYELLTVGVTTVPWPAGVSIATNHVESRVSICTCTGFPYDTSLLKERKLDVFGAVHTKEL